MDKKTTKTRSHYLSIGLGLGLSLLANLNVHLPPTGLSLKIDGQPIECESFELNQLGLTRVIDLLFKSNRTLQNLRMPVRFAETVKPGATNFQFGANVCKIILADHDPRKVTVLSRGKILKADFKNVTPQTITNPDPEMSALEISALKKEEVLGSPTPKNDYWNIYRFNQPGLLVYKVKIINRSGSIYHRYWVLKRRLEPVSQVTFVGILPVLPSITTSRGRFLIRQHLEMEATAYYPGPECTGKYAAWGLTYTGKKAGFGIVAVDPRVIPLGSQVYVEGYGHAEAADIGGDIKGQRIDLCFKTYREAVNYGRKKVRVYLLE